MYQVGSFCFDIRNPHHVPVPDNLKRFETEQGTPEHLYRLTLVNHVEVKESEFMLNKDNMKVYVDEHVHKRYLFLKGDSRPYALCQKPIEHNATLVYVDAHYLPLFPADTIFGSILSLEKRMYFHNSFILHSAYICVNGKAVLFTAPSGGGKSTQAKLWADHRGARTINGDRTLLQGGRRLSGVRMAHLRFIPDLLQRAVSAGLHRDRRQGEGKRSDRAGLQTARQKAGQRTDDQLSLCRFCQCGHGLH